VFINKHTRTAARRAIDSRSAEKIVAYSFAAVTLMLVGIATVVAFGSASAVAAGAALGHGMAATPTLSGIGSVLATLAVVAIVTAVVAPIKQRLLRTRKASAPVRQPARATVAPSV
jgi:uncharacterized membrane protein